VRHLERVPLGIKYPSVVERVREVVSDECERFTPRDRGGRHWRCWKRARTPCLTGGLRRARLLIMISGRTMNSAISIPNGISGEVQDTALSICDELVRDGWSFGVIHWENERERKLVFTAKSPRGFSIYVPCGEHALVEKLKDLRDLN
jgi:hypothetical protein